MGFRARAQSPIIVNGNLTTPQIPRGGGYTKLNYTQYNTYLIQSVQVHFAGPEKAPKPVHFCAFPTMTIQMDLLLSSNIHGTSDHLIMRSPVHLTTHCIPCLLN